MLRDFSLMAEYDIQQAAYIIKNEIEDCYNKIEAAKQVIDRFYNKDKEKVETFIEQLNNYECNLYDEIKEYYDNFEEE